MAGTVPLPQPEWSLRRQFLLLPVAASSLLKPHAAIWQAFLVSDPTCLLIRLLASLCPGSGLLLRDRELLACTGRTRCPGSLSLVYVVQRLSFGGCVQATHPAQTSVGEHGHCRFQLREAIPGGRVLTGLRRMPVHLSHQSLPGPTGQRVFSPSASFPPLLGGGKGRTVLGSPLYPDNVPLSPVSPLTSALIYLASKMDHFIQSEGQRGQEMYPGCACRTAQEGSGGLPPNLVSRAPSHPLHTACNPTFPTLLLLPGFNWLAGLRPGISRAPENVFILMYFYISSKKEYNQNDYILMSPV